MAQRTDALKGLRYQDMFKFLSHLRYIHEDTSGVTVKMKSGNIVIYLRKVSGTYDKRDVVKILRKAGVDSTRFLIWYNGQEAV